VNVAGAAVASGCAFTVRSARAGVGAPILAVTAGSIDWPLSVEASVTSPLAIRPASGLTVDDGVDKACSNSRRAKASSVHSIGGWAGASGAVVAAKGLSTVLRRLDTIPAAVLTGVTVVGAVVAAALSIFAAIVVGGAMAADATCVVSRVVCTASVTT